jgi:hypothetical protein
MIKIGRLYGFDLKFTNFKKLNHLMELYGI